MIRSIFFAAACVTAASTASANVGAIVESHVLPGYTALADSTASLSAVAAESCVPGAPDLMAAYASAFDAWVSVSHLRFGPSEVAERGFALAFWPDPRGSTPKTLATMIRDEDPVVETADGFATVSVAVRGFYALEFLLFDPQFTTGDSTYRCALIQAIARDIAANAAAILTEWDGGYAALMAEPGNDIYRTEREAEQQFFTALTTGLEFTANMRLGRPLGTFDRPRPNRAEARRSDRSLRHIILSLEATRALAALVSDQDAGVDEDFARALDRARAIDDPTLAGVADPGARFRIEALQNSVITAYRTLLEDIGPRLGITAGFNSLDGD